MHSFHIGVAVCTDLGHTCLGQHCIFRVLDGWAARKAGTAIRTASCSISYELESGMMILFCDIKGNNIYNHYTWGNSSPFLYFIHYVEDTFRRCFIVRLLPPALTEWLHPRFWRPTGLVQLV